MNEDVSREPVYRTPDEVGRVARVGADAVTRWIREGKLPAVRTPGGRYLIDERDLGQVLRPVNTGVHEEGTP